MCCIVVCSKKRLAESDLDRLIRANPDGIGVAWIDAKAKRVRWHKALKATKKVRHLLATLPLPYVAHVRLATIGASVAQLAHPFPIEDKPRLDLRGSSRRGVLLHNGHVHHWELLLAATGIRVPDKVKQYRERLLWSDSRALASVVAHAGSSVLGLVTSSRFAVVRPSGVQRFGSGWTIENGIAFSSPVLRTVTTYSFGRPSSDYVLGTGESRERDSFFAGHQKRMDRIRSGRSVRGQSVEEWLAERDEEDRAREDAILDMWHAEERQAESRALDQARTPSPARGFNSASGNGVSTARRAEIRSPGEDVYRQRGLTVKEDER